MVKLLGWIRAFSDARFFSSFFLSFFLSFGRTDADECLLRVHACHGNAQCLNTNGSYTCACEEGYEGLGRFFCINIDECALGTHTCDSKSSVCRDTRGGFQCPCRPGFVGMGKGKPCSDIDECRYMDMFGCHANSSCRNYPGGFACECSAGFTGDGHQCDDVDECDVGSVTSDDLFGAEAVRSMPRKGEDERFASHDRDKKGPCTSQENNVCVNVLGWVLPWVWRLVTMM